MNTTSFWHFDNAHWILFLLLSIKLIDVNNCIHWLYTCIVHISEIDKDSINNLLSTRTMEQRLNMLQAYKKRYDKVIWDNMAEIKIIYLLRLLMSLSICS